MLNHSRSSEKRTWTLQASNQIGTHVTPRFVLISAQLPLYVLCSKKHNIKKIERVNYNSDWVEALTNSNSALTRMAFCLGRANLPVERVVIFDLDDWTLRPALSVRDPLATWCDCVIERLPEGGSVRIKPRSHLQHPAWASLALKPAPFNWSELHGAF